MTAQSMQSLRFHAYGEPADVLRLEEAAIPDPAPGSLRIRVHACGLNPADWALCRGLFATALPRGIGLDVSGLVDAVGEGVTGVSVGDPVLGPANYSAHPTAGAADFAILDHWAKVPTGLDMTHAAALTMAVETGYRSIDWLDVKAGQTLVVNGGGTMVGFAAVQMALLRGARVIATAGETFAPQLRALGADVTPYGEGIVERVRQIAGGSPDLIFDIAPVNLKPGIGPVGGVLPDLIRIAGGEAGRVLTFVDMETAAKLGVRNGFAEPARGPNGSPLRYDVLGQFAELAAEGRFSIPIARSFPFADWREALDISLSGHARGKLMLLPG